MAIMQTTKSMSLDLPATFNLATRLIDDNVVAGRGDRVAIMYQEEEITYRLLLEMTNRAGNALRRLGTRIENRVFLLLPDCPEFHYTFLGALKLGAVPVPASTLLAAGDYAYMLNDSRAVVAVVGEQLLPQFLATPREELRYLQHIVVAGDGPPGTFTLNQMLADSSDVLDAEPTSPDDIAFWLYSSGTTGRPKAVVHLHQDALHCCVGYAHSVLDIDEADRTFSMARLFSASGIGNSMTFPFLVGGGTVLYPQVPSTSEVQATFERHRPTVLFARPRDYATLLDAEGEPDLSSLRVAVCSGERLAPDVYERFASRFGVEILEGVGSTEALHIYLSNRPGRVRPGSSGELVPGYEARLVDEDSLPVPLGEIGDLLLKGGSVCASYWNNRQKTKETIRGEWLATGDKYRQDQDGYFWYAGRSDDMWFADGAWISPVDIELDLLTHQAVGDVGVVGVANGSQFEPLACVVLRAGAAPSSRLIEDLQQQVRGRLGPRYWPRTVVFVDSLPRTVSGKVQRYRLRSLKPGS
jgi:benzoate-CoA ligase family protein